MNETPIVSICCLSYNHAAFIRQCLDGFLMQKVSFPIEVLIHDDASTDGTDLIIKEYADRYPDLIFPLFEKENQFSKGKSSVMDIEYNYSRARGKYIATCEGDDYWTDPSKLQKQVDFLEAHPEYSVCFHRCKHLFLSDGQVSDDLCGEYFNGNEGVDVSFDMLFKSWITQPLSMVFRKSNFDSSWQKKYERYRDVHEIFHLMKQGKAYLFSFYGGVYVKHGSGMSSLVPPEKQGPIGYFIAEELFESFPKDRAVVLNLTNLLRYVISWHIQVPGKSRFDLIREYLILTKDVKFVIKDFAHSLRRSFRDSFS